MIATANLLSLGMILIWMFGGQLTNQYLQAWRTVWFVTLFEMKTLSKDDLIIASGNENYEGSR